MAKLSSRVDEKDSLTDTLSDFLFLLRDAQGRDTSVPDGQEQLLIELDQEIYDIATSYQEVSDMNLALASDMLSLSVQNAELAFQLRDCVKVLKALANPVTNEDILEHALGILRLEGGCEMNMKQDQTSDTGLLMQVTLTFDENKLREALRTAIESYNSELAQHILLK